MTDILFNPFTKPAVQRVIECRLSAFAIGHAAGVRLADDPDCDGENIRLIRDRGRIVVGTALDQVLGRRHAFTTMWRRGWVFVRLFSQTSTAVSEVKAGIGDRCEVEGPALAFCSNRA